jgi:methionine transaminase
MNKLPDVGTTIFTIMSRLAAEHNAINLAQGFPDFACSEELISNVTTHMLNGANQYAPMAGVYPLREQIANKAQLLYGVPIDPETEITITCGATEACYTSISATVTEGDEVIVFEPAFDIYVPAIKLNGGKPVFIELSYPDYKPDWNRVKEAITEKTKLIIINSPHNPTGSVLSKQDMLILEELIKDKNIYLLSDEVYEHIIFDSKHQSALLFPELRKKTFVISSLGKTFHTTGWRIGYCVAPPDLTNEFRKIHQYVTFSAPTPFQYAMADYMKEKNHYTHLPDFFNQKRDLFLDLLKESRFTYIPSEGTYFQLLSYKKIAKEGDIEMAEKLTRETGVASIPISCFYHNRKDENLLRFCFAKEDRTLIAATEKLCKI